MLPDAPCASSISDPGTIFRRYAPARRGTHTVVCHVAAEEEAAPAAAFAGIKVFYDSEVMDAGISMSFSDFGRSTPNPDPGDASQWTRRELAEMNVELTYVFDGEDYDLACRKGKRH